MTQTKSLVSELDIQGHTWYQGGKIVAPSITHLTGAPSACKWTTAVAGCSRPLKTLCSVGEQPIRKPVNPQKVYAKLLCIAYMHFSGEMVPQILNVYTYIPWNEIKPIKIS